MSNMVDSQQKFSSRTQREMGETKKMVKKVEGMTRKVCYHHCQINLFNHPKVKKQHHIHFPSLSSLFLGGEEDASDGTQRR